MWMRNFLVNVSCNTDFYADVGVNLSFYGYVDVNSFFVYMFLSPKSIVFVLRH